jgi:OOP family OmpA-OmpF porin
MNRKLRNLALLAAGLLAGATASAQEVKEGLYFAVGLGSATVDVSKNDLDRSLVATINAQSAPATVNAFGSDLDDSVNFWTAQVGYRFMRYFAAEIGYLNFGDTTYEANLTTTTPATFFADNRIRATGVSVSGLGIFPFADDRFEVYGRGGLFFADTRSRFRTANVGTGVVAGAQASSDSKDFFIGIGGVWNISESFAVRLEYNLYLDVGDDDHLPEQNINLIQGSIMFR